MNTGRQRKKVHTCIHKCTSCTHVHTYTHAHVQDKLTPDKHINRIFGDTYSLLQNISVAFHYMDKDMMKKP